MVFGSLSALMKKNFLIFFRSKFSSALIILIPLFIAIAAGYAFDTSSLTNVYVGVHSSSSSNLTQNIISGFNEKGFLVKEYGSSQECIDAVKMNLIQICSIFSMEGSNSTRDSVDFYVDYSRINLADTLVKNAESSVHEESASEGEFFVQDLINIINLVKENLPEAKTVLTLASSGLEESQGSVESWIVPSSDFDSVINSLESARSETNDSSLEDSLSDAIILLQILKTNNAEISVNLDSQSEIYDNLLFALGKINPVLDLADSREIESAENIISPIKMSVNSINEGSKSRDYFMPVLFSLIALFSSLLLSSAFVLNEKKTQAYFRNFMTPTRSMTFIFSTYLTCLAIILVQFGLVFLGVEFILGMNLFSMPLEFLSILVVSLTAFIFIGMFIGYVFRSEESVIFASMITAGIFLFFSNTIIPIENTSGNLISFSFLNPLILLDSAFKKVLLFGLSFSSIILELTVLFGFFIVFLVLTYFVKKITRREPSI